MTVDYAVALRQERNIAHAVFHSVILALSKSKTSDIFLFFEGEDDPAFYQSHIRIFLHGFNHNSFICYGRSEVLKVFDLITNDSRAIGRSLFFIDKDHNDVLGAPTPIARNIFQTTLYSIENYLVSEEIFSAYWSEILHLDTTDPRKIAYQEQFRRTYVAYSKRMCTLMAFILYARGFEGAVVRKLNLNNVRLELMFRLNFDDATCRYQAGAGKHFAIATNVRDHPISACNSEIRRILRSCVRTRTTKEIVRGKYELWFFVKFLQNVSHQLSSRQAAKASGLRRATPKIFISIENAVEILSSRLNCPPELSEFLKVNRKSLNCLT